MFQSANIDYYVSPWAVFPIKWWLYLAEFVSFFWKGPDNQYSRLYRLLDTAILAQKQP